MATDPQTTIPVRLDDVRLAVHALQFNLLVRGHWATEGKLQVPSGLLDVWLRWCRLIGEPIPPAVEAWANENGIGSSDAR